MIAAVPSVTSRRIVVTCKTKGIAMSAHHRTLLFSVGLLVAAVVLPGCNQRLQQERDALFTQNRELQDKLDQARADLAAAQGKNTGLLAELDALRNQPAAVSIEQTGFSDIAGVDVIQGAGTLTVRVPGDVLFSSGRVDLKNSAKQTLGQIAGVLQSEHPHNTVRIAGHTDTDPIKKSGWKDNLELSLQRAAAVQRYLESQGIDSDRMYSAGYGETRPAESKDKSRRVEIVVVLQE